MNNEDIIKVVKVYVAGAKGGLVVRVPAEIEKRLNIKPGEKMLVSLKDDSITYRPLRQNEQR
jgi:AbrB family looped-hinge helix DNA binding protein